MTRFRLSVQILLLALLNFLLLGALFLALAGLQFRGGVTDILLNPARDRLLAVGRLIALEVSETSSRAAGDAVLAHYSELYDVKFLLFENEGRQIAGRELTLPREVASRLRGGPSPDRPPPRDRPPPPPRRAGPEGRNGLFVEHVEGSYWVGLRVPSRDPVTHEDLRATLLLQSPTLFGNTLFIDWPSWVTVMLAILGITALCWLPFIHALTKEIGVLTKATEQIAEGKFNFAAKSNRHDELGRLSGSIETLALKLSDFVTGQKRFLGGIAHELSSPIARTQWALGIIEREIPESQKEQLSDLNEEVQHMARLVNELLVFSKAGIEGMRRALVDVDVASVIEKAVRREVVSGEDVRMSGAAGIFARADEEYLGWSVANLIRNALRYAGTGGPVEITWGREVNQVWICVADSGPGLPEAELEKVFAPFYRLDAARTPQAGGTGLGLAIVKSSIEACGGTVSIQNRQPNGLIVQLRLQA